MTERSRGQPGPRSISETVRGDSAAALLLAPDDGEAKSRARHELFRATDPGETHVVGVVYDGEQFLDHVHEHGLHPATLTLIVIDSTDHVDTGADDTATVAADTVATGDVDAITVDADRATTITDHVTDKIDEVSAAATGSPRTVLCFDSLTALIHDVGIEQTFRCLDSLLTDLDSEDVRANFHLDPAAHPERARLALTTLFDTVVEATDGETWNRPGPSAGWSPHR